MEKMNQVSVSEFFAKSKEEMYDMAVEMVEKYNRLVDICNDSAERMAELMAKDDINEFKKELQSREPGELKIQKLPDIVVWADSIIRCKAYEKKVAELKKESEKWQDLAKMNRDTICNQYDVCEDFKKKIAEIEEENEKLKVDLIHEREKNEKLAKDYAVQENDMRKYTTEIISQSGTICNLKKELDARGEEIKKLEEKVKHQRENLDGINKTLEIRTNENESLIKVRNNLEREIEAHESENARLSEKIKELKRANGIVANIISALTHEEDDHGKSGFKRYIEHLIEEEERAVPERFKERLNKEITEIFTKEEETEVKGNGRTSSGRYPWGAKVNDIPCGEDAIE